MSHCIVCGGELVDKYLENEGMIPYCEQCEAYRFRMFNTAISTIVYNPDGDKIALIQQYGLKRNVLVAGYVTIGESVEETLIREVGEELGLHVTDYRFNASEYYEKNNVLMVNFACKVDSECLDRTNYEIDHIRWYTPDEAYESMEDGTLAKKFVGIWLKKSKYFQ